MEGSQLRWAGIRYRARTTRLRLPLVWIRHRGINPRDVFLASYPRSGNTWLRFILYELITGESGDFKRVDQFIPYVGRHHRAPDVLPGGGRLLKTHEHYRNEYKKAIYLLRDPRDVLVSNYFFFTNPTAPGTSIREFTLRFLDGKINAFGRWERHLQSWLESPLQRAKGITVIRYEDLIRRPNDAIVRLLEFLGRQTSLDEVRRALRNNRFENMRDKEKMDPHYAGVISERGRVVRQGHMNGWRDFLSDGELKLVERQYGQLLREFGYS